MIDIFNDFEIELSGTKYLIRPSKKDDTWGYSLAYEGKEHIFKCLFNMPVLKDAQSINGIDALTELTHIINLEIRYELFQLVYECSILDIFHKTEKCSTDFELFALSQQEPLVAAWLDNFDRRGD